MVDPLLTSQLFGPVRGSFMGAADPTPGLCEYANNGTVFLDEIRETSLPIQAKLQMRQRQAFHPPVRLAPLSGRA